MNKLLNKIVTIVVLSWLSVTVSSATTPPSREQIKNYLQIYVYSQFRLGNFEYKNFEGLAEGVGRTSIEGSLVLRENVYEVSQPPLLWRNLSDAGISESRAKFLMSITYGNALPGEFRELVVKERPGKVIKFRTDLNFKETVSGFEFEGGDSLLRRQDRFLSRALPRGDTRRNDYVVGTKEHENLALEIVKLHNADIGKRNKAYLWASSLFSGKSFVLQSQNEGSDNGLFTDEIRIDCPIDLGSLT